MSEPSASSAASSSERGRLPAGRAGGPGSVARGRWLVFGAAFFWATSATLARYVFRDRHVPALTVVELRLAVALAILGPWLAWRKPSALAIRREDWGYFIVLGLFGVAAMQGAYYYSISVLGVGLAILIQYLAPSLIVLYDLLRGARVSGRTFAAAAAALAGTALLVGDVDPVALHATPLQWAIGFASALVFAFYILFSKRALRRYAPETIHFYGFLVAVAFWAVITPPWRIAAAGYDGNTWLLLIAIGVGSALVPFALFYAGLRRLTPSQAGIIATLEPVMAVLAAAFFLHEGLQPLQWLGAALVLAASVLASAPGQEPAREHV